MGVLDGGGVVADVGFMLSDPTGGNGGIPLVDEGKLDLEEGIGSRAMVLWLDGQGKCVVCCRYVV